MEQQKKDRDKAHEELIRQAAGYQEKLEELHIKNDGIANDEKQLLELQRDRAVVAIEASKADVRTKNLAIEAARSLYDEQIRLSEEKYAEEERLRQENLARQQEADEKTRRSLSNFLATMGQTRAQAEQEQIAQTTGFLQAHLDAEKLEGQKRIDYLKEQLEIIRTDEVLSNEARLSAVKAANDLILAEDEKLKEKQKQNILNFTTEVVNSAIELASTLSDIQQLQLTNQVNAITSAAESEIQILRDNAAKKLENDALTTEEREKIQTTLDENIAASEKMRDDDIKKIEKEAQDRAYGAAIAEKALASGQAAINTYLAATAALAAGGGVPWGLIPMALTIAAGVAQQIKIATTPLNLPSAETGGRFIVPNSVGSDNTIMKVNSGEEVDITPRGMSGFSNKQQIIVQIEKQTIFDVMNEGIRSGDILIQATNF